MAFAYIAKCDEIIAKVEALKISGNYSKHFFPVPEEGPPEVLNPDYDQPCVDAAEIIIEKAEEIKASAITSTITTLTTTPGPGDSLILAASLGVLTPISSDVTPGYENWCSACALLESGNFLTTILNYLNDYISGPVRTLPYFRSMLQLQVSFLTEKIPAITSILDVLGEYSSLSKTLMSSIGVQSMAISSEVYRTQLGALTAVHAQTNSLVMDAYTSIPTDGVERTQQELREASLLALGEKTGASTLYPEYLTTMISLMDILNK